MEENVYAPPSATLVREEAVAADFYVVSKRKFYTLFIMTLGLYQVYWYYRNWKLYRRATGEKVLPVMRAIFAVFFVHGLFRRVQAGLRGTGKSFEWNPTALAWWVVGLMLVSEVVDRLSGWEIGAPYTDALGLALIPTLACALVKGQAAINACCGDPTGTSNDCFTLANCAWIVLGGLLYALIAAGLAIRMLGLEAAVAR